MGVMDLSNGNVVKVERVKSFQVPEDAAGFVAYLLEAPLPEKPNPTPTNHSASQGPADPLPATPSPATSRSQGGRGNKKKEYGTDLVLRDTINNTERKFADVLDFTFSKDGRSLVFATSSKQEQSNGVYSVTPQTDVAPTTLLVGKGKYQRLTWDEDNTQLAFISDKDDADAKQPRFSVYHWNRKDAPAVQIVST